MITKLHTNNNNEFFRQLFFILVLLAIGVVVFGGLYFFVGSVLGAITIYLIFRGLLFRMIEKRGIKNWLAALIIVLGTTLFLVVSGYLLVTVLVSELPDLDTSRIVIGFNKAIEVANQKMGLKLSSSSIIGQSGGYLGKVFNSLIDTTYSLISNMIMMVVILYFMLVGGRRMESSILRYTPFSGESLDLLRHETKNIIFSNAVGIPIVMLAQGVTALLIYWLLGMNSIFFWAFLTAVCGLIPLIGTAIVYLPLSLFFFADGELWSGVILLIYGLVVIGNIDSVVKVVLMKKVADTHPLVVIFGVILGIPIFGFWGIIFGPLLIAGFILLIRIYYVEYQLIEPYEEMRQRVKRERTEHKNRTKRRYNSVFAPLLRLFGVAKRANIEAADDY